MATEKKSKNKNKQKESSGQDADVGLDKTKKKSAKNNREKAGISSRSPEPAEEVVDKKEKEGRKEYKKKRDRREGEGDHKVEDEGEKKKRVIDDPRFASMHFDPRFQRMPKKEAKVTVDDRFARMLTDRNFDSSHAPVDKRGKRKKGKGPNPLLHYYLHQKDEEEDDTVGPQDRGNAATNARHKMVSDFKEDPSDEDDEEGDEERSDDDEVANASISSESSSSDDDEEDDDDDGQYSVGSDIAHILMANHEDTPMTDTETHRLAVVNLDWSHIKAVDLYVIMSSCLPNGGQIASVAVYPSEFGLKCLEIETVNGPAGLFNNENDNDEDDNNVDDEKLRSYELNKLRYYFAVVVCDSSATANHIYNTLDGTELLKTSNVFDLRFIPDSMEFKHPPRDVATEAPSSYKQPDFETHALQHSKVKLTWEEDEAERKKILRRKFNPNQLDELNEYLASTSESDEGDDDERNDIDENEPSFLPRNKAKKLEGIEKLRALLQSKDDSDGDDADDKDMEITFNTELEDLSKRILEKKDKKSETVWEAVLRKRSEKRKAMKNRSKYSDEDDSSDYDVQETPDQTDDFFVEEPLDTQTEVPKGSKKLAKVKGSKRKGNGVSMDLQKEQEASRVELELLLADDNGTVKGPKGYNLKTKKTKGKKGKEEVLEEKIPNVDISNDARFSALGTSHNYALDPTDPQYKRSAAYLRQQSQKKKKDVPQKQSSPTKEDNHIPGEDELIRSSKEKEKSEFSATVRSLKRNIGTLKIHRQGR